MSSNTRLNDPILGCPVSFFLSKTNAGDVLNTLLYSLLLHGQIIVIISVTCLYDAVKVIKIEKEGKYLYTREIPYL
jgi:hypothetical protein